MGRWQPDSRGRLIHAATELYAERGFEQTTVAEIAERAGLTERTFFRQFADKREVLFAGGEVLEQFVVDAVRAAPPETTPLDTITEAFVAWGHHWFHGPPVYPRQRQAIIDSHPSLQERELIKMAHLGAAVAGALRERGVPGPAAAITAEAGLVVFRVAFDRWLAGDDTVEFADLVRAAAADLRAATA